MIYNILSIFLLIFSCSNNKSFSSKIKGEIEEKIIKLLEEENSSNWKGIDNNYEILLEWSLKDLMTFKD